MTYLCILFTSPLYFLSRKQWGGFVVNVLFYGLALLLVLTLIGAAIAPFFWIIAVGHASFAFRKEAMEEHAEILATKMAEKLREKP